MLGQKIGDAGLLIFLGWLMYSTSYLGKVNFSANITQVMDYYGVTKAEAGIVPTFLFFSYGIGQVANGLLCKHYNMRWMIFTGLLTSAVVNFIIAVSSDFAIIKWLWLINGFSLSILWPTLIRLISETVSQKELPNAAMVLGTCVAVGTLIIYALSSVFAIFDNFKLAFYTAAICGIIVSFIWVLFYKKAVNLAKKERDKEVKKEEITTKNEEKIEQTKNEKKIFFTSVYILCFCAIGVNLIKDGLSTWVPTILKEGYGITDSLSILLTLFLPVVAIFGNVFAIKMHKKIPDCITHCFVFFSVMAAFIGIIIGSMYIKQVLIVLIGLVAVSFFASSLNSLVTSIFPMFMRGRVNSGLFAGILNGFCYLGSTISSYGLGVIAQNFGWIAVFWVLIGFCAVVAVIWCIYALYKRILIKKDIEQ